MRLGQLARKYNLKQEQVIEFLENHNPGMGPYHHNNKLSDQVEDLIASKFDTTFLEQGSVETAEETSNESTSQGSAEEEQTEHEEFVEPGIEANIQVELDPTLPVIEEREPAQEVEEPKAIATDKLIELLDSEDEEVDLSDITLIKAPKKELEGLKVVGKIDLPEPKPKAKVETEQTEQEDSSSKRDKRQRRNQLSPEEKEKRRLRAKKKKLAYEARQEKKRLEEEAKLLKARKKAHYEQKVQKNKSTKVKKKVKVEEEPVDEVITTKAAPKSALGRFWAWFWHGK